MRSRLEESGMELFAGVSGEGRRKSAKRFGVLDTLAMRARRTGTCRILDVLEGAARDVWNAPVGERDSGRFVVQMRLGYVQLLGSRVL
jgi:hypothetical protein